MKKSKFVLATVAATVFAVSAGALVACGDSDDNKGKGGGNGVYEITVDANGGTFATGTTVKYNTVDGKVTDSVAAPTRTGGYAFNGYNLKSDGSGTVVTFGTSGYTFTKNETVYAQWTEITGVYTITYDANGGNIVGSTTAQTINGKLPTLLDSMSLEYSGHKFDGWYTSATGGTKVTTETVFTGNDTVYAHWTPIGTQPGDDDDDDDEPTGVFTITFHAGEGTLTGESTAKTSYNVLGGAMPTNPTPPDGMLFDGWYTQENGLGDRVTGNYNFTADADVYAYYIVDDTPQPSVGYILGINGWEVENGIKLSGPTTNDYGQKEYSASFTTTTDGAELKILLNDIFYAHLQSDVPSTIATGGGFTNGADNIVITNAGTYDLYLKIYQEGSNDSGSHDIWIQKGTPIITEPEIHPETTLNGVTMTDNTTGIDKVKYPTQILEYYATGVALGNGDTVEFTVDSEICSFYVDKDSKNIDISETDIALRRVAVLADGLYDFYLKQWNNGSWTVYGEKVGELPVEDIGEQEITLDANGGVLTTGATVTTNQYGRLEALPAAPTAPDGYEFDGWYTAATGGTKVTTATVFEEPTTIYAQFVEEAVVENYVSVNSVAGKELVYIAPSAADGETQYGVKGVTLAVDDEVSFNLVVSDATGTTGGSPVTFVVNQSSKGIVVEGIYSTGTIYTKVIAAVDGSFNFYLKHYEGDKDKWVLVVETTAVGAEQVTGTESLPDGIIDVDTTSADKGYMVGDLNGTGEFDGDHGVAMTPGTNEFSLTNYHLDAGAIIKFRNGDGSFWTAAIQSDSPAAANFEIVKGDDGQDNIKVVKSGTYTFYVKTMKNSSNPGKIYIMGTADLEGEIGDSITVTAKFKDATVTFNIENNGTLTPYLWIWTSTNNLTGGTWPGKAVSDGDELDFTTYSVTQVQIIVNYGNGNAQTTDLSVTKDATITVAKDGGSKIE